MNVAFIGDTGSDDVSDDNDCGCDAKILSIELMPFEVHIQRPNVQITEDFDGEVVFLEQVFTNYDVTSDGVQVIANSNRSINNEDDYLWTLKRISATQNIYEIRSNSSNQVIYYDSRLGLSLRNKNSITPWTNSSWYFERAPNTDESLYFLKSVQDDQYLQVLDNHLLVNDLVTPPFNNNAKWMIGRNRAFTKTAELRINLEQFHFNIRDFIKNNPDIWINKKFDDDK